MKNLKDMTKLEKSLKKHQHIQKTITKICPHPHEYCHSGYETWIEKYDKCSLCDGFCKQKIDTYKAMKYLH